MIFRLYLHTNGSSVSSWLLGPGLQWTMESRFIIIIIIIVIIIIIIIIIYILNILEFCFSLFLCLMISFLSQYGLSFDINDNLFRNVAFL